jgi:hypothetical protein
VRKADVVVGEEYAFSYYGGPSRKPGANGYRRVRVIEKEVIAHKALGHNLVGGPPTAKYDRSLKAIRIEYLDEKERSWQPEPYLITGSQLVCPWAEHQRVVDANAQARYSLEAEHAVIREAAQRKGVFLALYGHRVIVTLGDLRKLLDIPEP